MKRIAYLLSGKISFIVVFLCLIFNVKGQEITFDPADLTENVSVSTEIIITLSDSAYNTNSTELTSTNIDALIVFREGGEEGIAVQFDATINDTKNIIKVIPNNSLAEKTTYYVSAGNGITSDNGIFPETEIIFSTEDNTSPIVTIFPNDGDNNVPDTVEIYIAFDEPVRNLDNTSLSGDLSSIIIFTENDQYGNAVGFTTQINELKDSILIIPDSPLQSSYTYFIEVNSVEDNSDNAIDTTAVTFSMADFAAPVSTFNPSNNAVDVQVTSLLTIKFDEPVRLQDNIPISNDNLGSLIILKIGDENGEDVGFTATINITKDSITINPTSDLLSEQTYYFGFDSFAFEDNVNNPVPAKYIAFTAEDIGPRVSFCPENGATGFAVDTIITIAFHKAVRNLDNSAVDSTSAKSLITFKEDNINGSDVYFGAGINTTFNTITITPSSDLKDLQTYYLAINAYVEDIDDKAIQAQSIGFTTKDATGPQITFNPADEATDVQILPNLLIVFNEPVRNIDNTEITDQNLSAFLLFKETNQNGADVDFSATINGTKDTITVTPNEDLNSEAIYYLKVLANFEDISDNVNSTGSILFTTEDAAFPVVEIIPADQSTVNSIYCDVVLTFNEPVRYINDSPILNTNLGDSIIFKNSANSQNIPFTASINDARNEIVITPTEPSLTGETNYYIELVAVEDENDNATGLITSSFTTEIVGAYVTFSPAEGDTMVLPSGNITLTFDKVITLEGGVPATDTNIDSLITLRDTTNGIDVAFDATIASNTIITINPTTDLKEVTEFYIAIGASFYNDNKPNAQSDIIFKTKSVTPPVLTFNTSAIWNGDITVSFDKYIRRSDDDSEITNDNVDLFLTFIRTSGSLPQNYTASINDEKTLITVTPESTILGNTEYKLTVSSNIEDVYDNAIVEESVTYITGYKPVSLIVDNIGALPNEYATILEAITAATATDTIKVIAGTFNEELSFTKQIVLVSYQYLGLDPDSTILTNPTVNPVIYIDNTPGDFMQILGFSINGNNTTPGIYVNNSTTTIKNVIIDNCYNGNNSGGGLKVENNSTIYVYDSEIKNCRSDVRGGGIKVNNSTAKFYNLIVTNNTCTNNGDGGGVEINNSDVDFINSLIVYNRSDLDGGGLVINDNSNVNIINSTIANNTIPGGYNGAGIQRNGPNSVINIVNSIVSDNHRDGETPNDNNLYNASGNSGITISYSLIRSGHPHDGYDYVNIGQLWPGEGNINVAPKFTDPDYDDFSLSDKSLAIGVGNPDATMIPETDITGANRIQGGANPDLGAYESALSKPDLYFERVDYVTGFLNEASIAWGDYDSDGDLDYAVSGSNESYVIEIYNNDNGIFTKIDAGIPKDSDSWGMWLEWIDYDMDGNLDLFERSCRSKIHRNNGDNTFTAVRSFGMPCHDMDYSYAWADFDNDNDLDFVTAEWNTRILENIDGNFIDRGDLNLLGINNRFTVAVGDYNNDGLTDLLLSGENNHDNTPEVRLYKNTGNFIFEQVTISFGDINANYAEFIDYDADGELELFFSVQDPNDNDLNYGIFYNYNSLIETFVEDDPGIDSIPEYDGWHSEFAWADVNNDGYVDLTLFERGEQNNYHILKIYENLQDGTFSEMESDIEIERTQIRSIAYGDFNSDSRPDLALVGKNDWGNSLFMLYENIKSNINNAPSVPANLIHTIDGDNYILSWDNSTDNETPQNALTYNLRIGSIPGGSDILNTYAKADGTLIKLVQGNLNDNQFILTPKSGTSFYWSVQAVDAGYTGSAFAVEQSFTTPGPLVEKTDLDFESFYAMGADWGDYDNDGDLDILVNNNDDEVRIYTNNSGEYTKTSISINDPRFAVWVDYDGDNDLDIFTSNWHIHRIFKNTDGNFEEQSLDLGNTHNEHGKNNKWFDYDRDGDLDLINLRDNQIYIYVNSDGAFTNYTITNFNIHADLNRLSLDLGDYDNDGDIDILVSGEIWLHDYQQYQYFLRIVKNNSDGTFSNTLPANVEPGLKANWIDYDNDGDIDMFVSGVLNAEGNLSTSVLYVNTSGEFTASSEPFDGLNGQFDGIEINDFDNDDDLDIFYWSENWEWDYNNPYSGEELKNEFYYYENENDGTFTQYDLGINNENLRKLRFADYDTDGDLDILMAKTTGIKIFNNGTQPGNTAPSIPGGLISEVSGSNITLKWNKSADTESLNLISYNLFMESSEGENYIISPSANIDNGKLLLPNTGNNFSDTSITLSLKAGEEYYWSVQAIDGIYSSSSFAEKDTIKISGTSFTLLDVAIPGASNGNIRAGDYNNDGYLDIILTGEHSDYQTDVSIMTNNGDSTFTVLNTGDVFSDLNSNWGFRNTYLVDYDADNDLDLSILNNNQNYLFNNTTNGFVKLDKTFGWTNENNNTKWYDIDNDGDLDYIKLEGELRAYINIGENIFSEQTIIGWDNETGINPFDRIEHHNASISLFDIDNDGDADIVVTAIFWNENWSTRLYKLQVYINNNNEYNLSQEITLNSINSDYTKSDIGDFDNDGDLDILCIVSGSWEDNGTVYLFENNDGSFSKTIVDLGEHDRYWENVSGDFDNDGDLDLAIVVMENQDNDRYKVKLFLNQNSSFVYSKTDFEDVIFRGGFPSITKGDINNDGNLDIIISGRDNSYEYVTKIFTNNSSIINNVPSIPGNLSQSVEGSNVILMWETSTDSENSGLDTGLKPIITYNLRIGTIPGGTDILSAQANSNGSLLLPANGNSGVLTTRPLELRSGNTYYWSVQAIDAAYTGSEFAMENSFTIDGPLFNIVASNDSTGARDVAWGDYDNDGDLDFAVATSSDNSIVIYNNNGSDVFNKSDMLFDENYSIRNVEWIDYDNDNDLDLFVNKNNRNRIYRNDDLTFTLIDITLGDNHNNGEQIWDYFDKDGKLDLLKINWSELAVFKKISDDKVDRVGFHLGNFDLQFPSFGMADYDKDGDKDLVIGGRSWNHEMQIEEYLLKLYDNVSGSFIENESNPFISANATAWVDPDNDGDYDIFAITADSSLLFINDNGVFTTSDFKFKGLQHREENVYRIICTDFDNDGNNDIVYYNYSDFVYYANNGDGSYTYYNVGISASDINRIDAADYDSDGDVDLIITTNNFINIYKNQSSVVNNAPSIPALLDPVVTGSNITFKWQISSDDFSNSQGITYNMRIGTEVGASDILTAQANSDGSLLIPRLGNMGNDTSSILQIKGGTKVFYSLQAVDPAFNASAFTTEDSLVTPGAKFIAEDVSFSNTLLDNLSWGDFEGDGDLDILALSTESDTTNPDMFGNYPEITKVKVFINEGQGIIIATDTANFIDDENINSTYWLDYDGDNDLDIFVKSDGRDRLYRNNDQTFEKVPDFITNDNWHYNSNEIIYGDYDNDGDLDIMFKKYDRVVLMRNIDNISYKEVQIDLTQITFDNNEYYYVHLYNSVAAFGDYDNDGDFDIVVSGDGEYYNESNNEWTRVNYVNIMRNDGNGVFTDIQAGLEAKDVKKLEWVDFDNDGNLDLFIRTSERDWYDPAVAQDKSYKLYRNNDGQFENMVVDLGELSNINDASWGDFDNDGDLDLAIRGMYRYNEWEARLKIVLYMNDGTGKFDYILTDVDDLSFVHGNSSMAWGDYDNDGDLDLLVSGRADWDNSITTQIFKNQSIVANTSPTTPTNTVATNDGFILNFSWDASTDNENNSASLTYNLMVGTAPDSSDIISAHVTTNGGLLKPESGNVQYNTSYSINTVDLKDIYYWSIQAVDAGYMTSDFTETLIVTPEPAFEEVSGFNLAEVKDGKSAWGDYDNDGDLDLIITGASRAGRVANLYNNDNGEFVNTNNVLERMSNGDVAWGDYDNDGDLDLILSGLDITNQGFTKLYNNDNGAFFEVTETEFLPVYSSALAWGDYDDDGDLDLALAGYSVDRNSDVFILYRNDGENIFVEENLDNLHFGNPFERFENGSLAWADMDNDGDLDLVYSGSGNGIYPAGGVIENKKVNNRYWNSDWGGWEERGINLTNGFSVMNSVFDLGDYDNDGDLDIVISGEMDNGKPATYIIKNNTVNRYDDQYYYDFQVAGFDSVYNSALAWGDYDNDGDLDLIIAGELDDASVTTKLYNNLGNDVFIEVGIDLLGVKNGFVAWGDIENDGDLDLIFTGSTQSGYTSKFIRMNMGNAINTPPSPPVNLSYVHDGYGKVTLNWDFGDDNETPEKGLSYNYRLGTTSGGSELSVLHSTENGTRILPAIGNAKGNTWELSLLPGTYYWSVQAIDGNLNGSAFSGENIIELNYDWQRLNFRGIIDRTIPGETEGKVAWADFDNDGDLDLAVIGKDDSRIWRNEGYYFYNIWSGGRLAKSDLAWGDFDNDGDLDLALAGDQGNRDPRTIILENNVEEEWFGEYWNFNFISGNGNFEGVFDGNISWLDYDNDGDLDFVVAGLDKGNRSVLKIYNFEYNEENGNFDITEISTTLVPVSNGSFTWGDYDNDEDLDLAQIGYDGATGLVTRIYRNDGDQFTDTEINLPGVENGTIEFADYDNDGDLDIFLSGEADFSTITTILENKLDDIFINRLPNFIPVSESNASWGDYDSDGDLDLIYSGRSPGLGGITKIYTNDGNNIFSDISFDLSDFDDATMAWGDYDGDNDLDIVITGQASSGSGSIMQVYKNVISSTENVKLKGKGLKTAKAPSKNTPPSIPSGLRINPEINVTEEETTIQFLWDASTDDYTDSPGLTYALRIGTTPGGSEIMAANANTNGVRKLSGKGNVEHNLSWSISLESGTYFWVVQAIDAAYSGSAFSVQQSFTLNEGLVDINYAPTNIYLTDTTIIEWQSVETVIGTLSAFDPDDDDTHTFDFGIGDGSDDNASFTIDGNVLKSAQEFDFSVKNIYYIRLKVTDNGGLSYEKPFQIQILDATGLEDIRSSSGIKVFPNPITNTAIIQLNNSNNEIFRFRLINMQGEVIKEINNISGNEITFHKNELPHGFYLIELISENGEVYRIKVIIQ